MKPLSLVRKFFHFSGSVIPAVYLLFDRFTTLLLVASLLVACCLLEVVRIKGFLDLHVVKESMKETERRRPTGSFYFILGALVTILLFPRAAAIPALFVLSIADPLSSLVGYRFGRTPLVGKTVEGTVAFFLVSYVILAFFPLRVHVIAASAFAASLTELLSSRLIDDNLWIPIVTALVITLLT